MTRCGLAEQHKDDYWAHSANKAGIRHRLREHLASVSQRVGEFAGNQPWADEARLAGLLHDLGKYGNRFQARLRGKDQGLDHWSQGAWLALTEHKAVAAALAIQGHHIGLQYLSKDGLRNLNLQKLMQNHLTAEKCFFADGAMVRPEYVPVPQDETPL